MGSHVHVKDDLLFRGVEIVLAQSHGEGRYSLYNGSSGVWEHHDDPCTEPVAEPLRFESDMARALYEALGKHFGLAPETASLRADFEHERARVDRMIDNLLKD